MSLPTWTPAALLSEARDYSGICWRVVESQSVVSTTGLTDTLAEQDLLEAILEESKPAIPPECRHLHYLMATPFRYAAPYPRGSRFRRAGRTPGVFYASEQVDTAMAELVFHRYRFFAESPDTPLPKQPGAFTAFAVHLATARAIDLTLPPLLAHHGMWTDPNDYAACQELAEAARTAEITLIRYASVRDADGRANVAALNCRAFAEPTPVGEQSWRIALGIHSARAYCEMPRRRLEWVRPLPGADARLG